MRRDASVALCLLGLLAPAATVGEPPEPPAIPLRDRVRIAEAFRLADALGNRLWPDWDKAPFAVLLITPEHEFLIRHPSPTSDFTSTGGDAALEQEVRVRSRQFPTNLLATFPAVGGVPTIVIGQAENTEAKTSSRWVITLLHEHFHQLQDSRPGHDAAVQALDLARGDQTGMWMLDYPFPYADPEVNRRFSALGRSLVGALQARGRPRFDARLAAYVETRRRFQGMLAADDARYLAFQLWKEGIARYTECRLAELAATEYEPGREFRDLEDYEPFGEVARRIRRGIERELRDMRLDEAGRSVVYNFGAAEGLLLDAAYPGWRERYFAERFTLDGHFVSRSPE